MDVLLPPRRQLAADLAEILRFARYRPDVDCMAELLLMLFREGRYQPPMLLPVGHTNKGEKGPKR